MLTLHFPTRPPDPQASRRPCVAGHIRPETPAVVCSWCGEEMADGSEPVSHGICEDCLEERWQEMVT